MLVLLANKNKIKLINKELIIYLLKILFSALIMAGVVVLVNLELNKLLFGGMIKDIIRMLIGAFLGVVIYFAVTIFLKVNELKSLFKKD